jgi:hypothetical protein
MPRAAMNKAESDWHSTLTFFGGTAPLCFPFQWQRSQEACQKDRLNGLFHGLHSTLMYSEVGVTVHSPLLFGTSL